MQIGVVDYGVGNIANVMRCLEYVARTESIKRVSTHKDIQACDKIILPGVGAFGSAMEHLTERDLDKSLCEYAKSGRYMLGICLGMQLLFEKSYEFGKYKGLGLVEGFVAPFGSRESIEWYIKTNINLQDIESKGLDSTKSYPTPNNHSIGIESRFYKVCTHPNGRESSFDTRCTPSPEYTHKDKETRFYENTPQNTTLTQVSEKLDSKTMACHTEPLGEVSKAESNKDISLTKLAQYDKNHNIEWKSFKCEELFSVKSNPQLNKDSFNFSENAPYPYFTRTCLNNGIAGYVEYLDEEHKIKGESIAVGMLGMQFFYMQKDFYAGQFTKTLYPKFSGLNATIAQFFITWLNKNQKIFQGVLVRDFEKTFNETEILLPVLDSNNIDFNFIESFIKALQKECIKSVVLWQEREREAYKKVVK